MTIPTEPIGSIPRPVPLIDAIGEHETEIRRCLKEGAFKVQVDFTEARLAMKVDPSGGLLNSFIDLNNLALSRFSSFLPPNGRHTRSHGVIRL